MVFERIFYTLVLLSFLKRPTRSSLRSYCHWFLPAVFFITDETVTTSSVTILTNHHHFNPVSATTSFRCCQTFRTGAGASLVDVSSAILRASGRHGFIFAVLFI